MHMSYLHPVGPSKNLLVTAYRHVCCWQMVLEEMPRRGSDPLLCAANPSTSPHPAIPQGPGLPATLIPSTQGTIRHLGGELQQRSPGEQIWL